MRVTLIRPRTANTPAPPLGILTIATCARHAGHEVQVLDPGIRSTDTAGRVAEFNPDVVGFSILTTQVARAQQLLREITGRIPGCFTVAGGIHPSALPEQTLREMGFDLVVIGEGEITFLELLDRLSAGGDPAGLAGTAVIRDGRMIEGPPRPYIQDLDTIPYPDRSIIDFERYLRPPGNIRGVFLRRATSLILSRGCPFGCVFCSSRKVFGTRVRRRSIPHVMAEIRYLMDHYRIDGFWFLDDTLLEDLPWLEELCRGLKSTGLPWGCQAHVRRADEAVFRTMRDSGCVQIEFGVESGSRTVLQRLRKGSDPDHVRHAFAICRRLGIRTLANFMIGTPDETESDARMSLSLAREIRPDHVVVTFTTPLPGALLYAEAVEKGWIPARPTFSSDWTIRQTEHPAVILSLNASTMIRIRKQFDNVFFWSNIRDYFLHPWFLGSISWDIIRHMSLYLPGFKRAGRTGRLSHLVETVWEIYNRV